MTGSPESADRPRSFLGELKRRHVFRVLAAYAVVAYVVLQVASLTFGPLHLPPAALTFVVVLAILGFPVAAVLAWAFETTPEGVRPTPAAEGAGRSHTAGLIAGVVLLTAAAGAAAWWWLGGSRSDAKAAGASRPPAVAADSDAPALPSDEIRLAILPFRNLSPDTADAYFADAMTEEHTSALASVPGFEVVSQRSAAKLATLEIPQIADSLRAACVLDGSARRAGGKVAITAQLFDGRGDTTVWSRRFERPARDELGLELDVARQIARSLRSSLTGRSVDRLADRSTDDPVAYDLYLRAQALSPTDSAGWRREIGLLRQALAHDSTFALAWLQLGMAYTNLGLSGGGDWRDSSRAATDRAVRTEKDPTLRLVMRALRGLFGGIADSTLAILDEAARRNPDNPLVVTAVGALDGLRGNLTEAARWQRKARDLDPLNAGRWYDLGDLYLRLGLDGKAERALRKAVDLDRTKRNAWGDLRTLRRLGGRYAAALALEDTIVAVAGDPGEPQHGALVYLFMGDSARARSLFERAFRSDPAHPPLDWVPYLVLLRRAAADTAGDGALVRQAEEVASRLPPSVPDPFLGSLQLAAVRGDADSATALLRTYVRAGGSELRALSVDPALEPVRSDPDFASVLRTGPTRIETQRRQVQAMIASDERR